MYFQLHSRAKVEKQNNKSFCNKHRRETRLQPKPCWLTTIIFFLNLMDKILLHSHHRNYEEICPEFLLCQTVEKSTSGY